MREDWELIESSLAKQYGIRIRQVSDMPWMEFCTLVSGLMSDTPLGQIVAIRSEKDPKVIKDFNPDQRKIRNDWVKRQVVAMLDNREQLDKDMADLAKTLASMFGKRG